MKRTFAILLVLFSSSLIAVADPNSSENRFTGIWYHLNSEERVDFNELLEIKKVGTGIAVTFRDTKTTYAGVLLLSADGMSIEGKLAGLGQISLSTVESLSEIRSKSLSMDIVGGKEGISLGFFQKREVLEKLLGKKLP